MNGLEHLNFAFQICFGLRTSDFGFAAAPIHVSATRNPRRCRAALSLLEVVLALAILFFAMAALGELVRIGLRSAEVTRDETKAQLLCESKMSEILAEISLPEPAAGVAFEDEPEWLFSIELEPTEQEGLMAMRVTVTQDFPEQQRPVSFSLVRWIPDPGIELPDAEESTSSDAENGNE